SARKCVYFSLFFFFQAEDGIRDRNVTGVQTCALPIFLPGERRVAPGFDVPDLETSVRALQYEPAPIPAEGEDLTARMRGARPERSEERRVGKECRRRRWRGQ